MKLSSLMTKTLVAVAMLTPVVPAIAAQTPEAASKAATAQTRKICKTIDMTGTRTAGKKYCLTSEQWKKFKEEERSTF